jgi:hypothetical protein
VSLDKAEVWVCSLLDVYNDSVPGKLIMKDKAQIMAMGLG